MYTDYRIPMEQPSVVSVYEEPNSVPSATDMSSDEIEQAIIYEWNCLQLVPSYIERYQIARRFLIDFLDRRS